MHTLAHLCMHTLARTHTQVDTHTHAPTHMPAQTREGECSHCLLHRHALRARIRISPTCAHAQTHAIRKHASTHARTHAVCKHARTPSTRARARECLLTLSTASTSHFAATRSSKRFGLPAFAARCAGVCPDCGEVMRIIASLGEPSTLHGLRELACGGTALTLPNTEYVVTASTSHPAAVSFSSTLGLFR